MADEKVHAIFFSMGGFTKNHPELLKETFDAGHTIGNHTWDHPNLKKSTDEKTKEEIDSTTAEINKVIGENPKIFRPPYGAYNQYTKNYVAQNKMVFTTWSLGAEDWVKKYQSKDILIKHVIEQLHPGANILMHELPWTSEAMPEIIKQIKAKGYTIIDPKYLEYIN